MAEGASSSSSASCPGTWRLFGPSNFCRTVVSCWSYQVARFLKAPKNASFAFWNSRKRNWARKRCWWISEKIVRIGPCWFGPSCISDFPSWLRPCRNRSAERTTWRWFIGFKEACRWTYLVALSEWVFIFALMCFLMFIYGKREKFIFKKYFKKFQKKWFCKYDFSYFIGESFSNRNTAYFS